MKTEDQKENHVVWVLSVLYQEGSTTAGQSWVSYSEK